jgi:hypothetical protein
MSEKATSSDRTREATLAAAYLASTPLIELADARHWPEMLLRHATHSLRTLFAELREQDTCDGGTALHWSLLHGCPSEVTKALLSINEKDPLVAKRKAPHVCALRTNAGRTPAHCAARGGALKTEDNFLSLKEVISAYPEALALRDGKGFTPVEWALAAPDREVGHMPAMIELLMFETNLLHIKENQFTTKLCLNRIKSKKKVVDWLAEADIGDISAPLFVFSVVSRLRSLGSTGRAAADTIISFVGVDIPLPVSRKRKSLLSEAVVASLLVGDSSYEHECEAAGLSADYDLKPRELDLDL